MGNGGSSPSSAEEESAAQPPTPGFRIVNVAAESSAAAAGLEPFLDYMLSLNGVSFESPSFQAEHFKELVRRCQGRTVTATLYNAMTGSKREALLAIPPSHGGEGAKLLGASIRKVNNVHERPFVLHVLQLQPDSPAEAAGLREETDYILGLPGYDFQSMTDLSDACSAASTNGAVLDLVVFSSITNTIRIVAVEPRANRGWKGLLGCSVGSGLLHNLPAAVAASSPSQGFSHTRQNEDDDEDEASSYEDELPPPPPPGEEAVANNNSQLSSSQLPNAAHDVIEQEVQAIRDLLDQQRLKSSISESAPDFHPKDFPCIAGEVCFPAPGVLYLVEA